MVTRGTHPPGDRGRGSICQGMRKSGCRSDRDLVGSRGQEVVVEVVVAAEGTVGRRCGLREMAVK